MLVHGLLWSTGNGKTTSAPKRKFFCPEIQLLLYFFTPVEENIVIDNRESYLFYLLGSSKPWASIVAGSYNSSFPALLWGNCHIGWEPSHLSRNIRYALEWAFCATHLKIILRSLMSVFKNKLGASFFYINLWYYQIWVSCASVLLEKE